VRPESLAFKRVTIRPGVLTKRSFAMSAGEIVAELQLAQPISKII